MSSALTSGMVGTTVSMMETVTVVGEGGVRPGLAPDPTAGGVPPAKTSLGVTFAAPVASSGADTRSRVGLAAGAIFAVVAGTLRVFELLHLPRLMFNIRLLK